MRVPVSSGGSFRACWNKPAVIGFNLRIRQSGEHGFPPVKEPKAKNAIAPDGRPGFHFRLEHRGPVLHLFGDDPRESLDFPLQIFAVSSLA
jgi:hypothetical protein